MNRSHFTNYLKTERLLGNLQFMTNVIALHTSLLMRFNIV